MSTTSNLQERFLMKFHYVFYAGPNSENWMHQHQLCGSEDAF